MSERAKIAQKIAEFIVDNKICDIYGGDVKQNTSKKGKPYEVGFSHACNLDGNITVFSPKFIQIGWQTRYGYVPQRDSWVFTSIDDALGFMKAAFVDFDEKNVQHFGSLRKAQV